MGLFDADYWFYVGFIRMMLFMIIWMDIILVGLKYRMF